MAEKPLLILPTPGEPVGRPRKFGGGANINIPTRRRQSQRLRPRFRAIQRSFDARRARLQVEAAGIAPEEVLVLETVEPIDDFFSAIQNIDGMERLGEFEEEDIPPDDDFFALDSKGQRKPEKALRGQLFLVFTNQRALEELLSLWNRWERDESLPRGLGRWKQLFSLLRNIRPWGVKDRLLETGVLDDWKERVEHDQEVVPCEIELWYRRNIDKQRLARHRVDHLINSLQGQIANETVIEDIAYHGLFVELPIASVAQII